MFKIRRQTSTFQNPFFAWLKETKHCFIFCWHMNIIVIKFSLNKVSTLKSNKFILDVSELVSVVKYTWCNLMKLKVDEISIRFFLPSQFPIEISKLFLNLKAALERSYNYVN
jgi:hypothetical protein